MAASDPTISWPLEPAALVSRDALATIERGIGEQFTWGQTKRRVDAISAALTAMGLDPGNRVGVLMPNSARHLELRFAIPHAVSACDDGSCRTDTPWMTINADFPMRRRQLDRCR